MSFTLQEDDNEHDNEDTSSHFTVEEVKSYFISVLFDLCILMSSSETADSFKFNDKNITSFLHLFQHLCKNHDINSDTEIMKRLSDYCMCWVTKYVMSNAHFIIYDWDEFCMSFKKIFQNQDIEHLIHTRDFLCELTAKQTVSNKNLHFFVYEYVSVTEKVMKKHHVNENQCCTWFLMIIELKMTEKVILLSREMKKKKITLKLLKKNVLVIIKKNFTCE